MSFFQTLWSIDSVHCFETFNQPIASHVHSKWFPIHTHKFPAKSQNTQANAQRLAKVPLDSQSIPSVNPPGFTSVSSIYDGKNPAKQPIKPHL